MNRCPGSPPEGGVTGWIVAVETSLAVAGVGWMALRGRLDVVPARMCGAHGIGWSLLTGVLVGMAVASVFDLAGRTLRPIAKLRHALAVLLGPLGRRDVVVLAAASGIGEETFFRLAMQDVAGLTWTAVVFGALHFGPRRELLPLPFLATGIGLLLGWLVDRGHGVLAAVVAHATINAVSLASMHPDRSP